MPIEHISDTARWVAIYRAMESERADALFVDPFARRLAGDRGDEIVRNMPRAQSSAWAMIVRTQVLDELIMHAIEHDGVDLVVNLAAGLDARPYRLPLPPSLRWAEVDLPPLLEYKASLLAGETPRCMLESYGLDLLADRGRRREVLARIAFSAQRALVVSEGLLIYLDREHVGELAFDLRNEEAFRFWLTDLASPRLLKMMRRMYRKGMNASDVTFRFAPEEGTDFFHRFGWKTVAFHSSLESARRLDRQMPNAWFPNLVGTLMPWTREGMRRMAGVVQLVKA